MTAWYEKNVANGSEKGHKSKVSPKKVFTGDQGPKESSFCWRVGKTNPSHLCYLCRLESWICQIFFSPFSTVRNNMTIRGYKVWHLKSFFFGGGSQHSISQTFLQFIFAKIQHEMWFFKLLNKTNGGRGQQSYDKCQTFVKVFY